jgi:hypothetical protein
MDDIYTTEQAAEFLGYAPGTLENWRLTNTGPRYLKPAGKVFYKKEDLVDWLENNKSGETT